MVNLGYLVNYQFGHYLVASLAGTNIKYGLVWECQKKWLTLHWVLAHKDVEGNEEADKLAKQRPASEFVVLESTVGILVSLARTAINR